MSVHIFRVVFFNNLNCNRTLISPLFTNLFHSSCRMEEKPIEKSIIKKLKSRLNPVHLSVLNESHMHNVPKGSETHFKVFVVSQDFENMTLLNRHCLINSLLENELKNGVHALSIVAKAPSQWDQNEEITASPTCHGGFGNYVFPALENVALWHERDISHSSVERCIEFFLFQQ